MSGGRVHPIPAAYLRGGTSKGVFLHGSDLPPHGPERDDLILRIMGSPDPMQIDGMGGTFSSTSKVVVVDPGPGEAVTYWFGQVGIDTAVVDWSGNCGNLTTAVAPFAIDEGLVSVDGPIARVSLLNGNTGVRILAEVEVEDGRAKTTGELAIAGVPGTGSPVVTRYLDPAGGVLGALFPTGSPTDVIAFGGREVPVSIVDAAHPYVFVDARHLGVHEHDARTPGELNGDPELLAAAESIRAAAAAHVGRAASVAEATASSPTVPRVVAVSPGDPEADLRLTAFSMGMVHRALPMTGALCAAAAASVPGTILSVPRPLVSGEVRLRHPRGVAPVLVELGAGDRPIASLGIVRTARRLMDGRVHPRD